MDLTPLVRLRLRKNRQKIQHSLRQIAAGNPLGAEIQPDRMVARIAEKSGLSLRDARAVSEMIVGAERRIERGKRGGPEALQGPTIDFVGIEFLTRGRIAANAVGRIAFRSGKAQGTGFLVGPGLLLTNNHVIETPQQAESMLVAFDCEIGSSGEELPSTAFALDSRRCFVSDPIRQLDFTLIAVGSRVRGAKTIDAFGYIPLSDAQDKHMLGEIANIIQHPLGQLKQLVVRENSLVARDETVQALHYIADTEKGSSGSPVCNNQWEPIALHHWGGPGLEIVGTDGRPLRRDINEGIRISAIVKALRAKAPRLDEPMQRVVGALLALWDKAGRRGPVNMEEMTMNGSDTPAGAGQARVSAGALTMTLPIEISIRIPTAAAVPQASTSPAVGVAVKGAERADVKFSSRGGYEPGFIHGFVVPLPTFPKTYPLARNIEAEDGDNPCELTYHHFSIFMNAKRKQAALTACNIDGSRLYAIKRDDKTIKKATAASDLDVESLGAESSDAFQRDPRVEDNQMAVEYYEEQDVPGYAKPKFPGKDASKAARSAYAKAMTERTARMFQKGHIVLRSDPAWGTENQALAAEADTFFYTNAAPQLGFFNQGSPDNRPGAKGKLRWRALETYILRNALTERQRVCVFAGPVFDDKKDPPYRFGSQVPMRFWKIAVWAEDGKLRSIAVIADQRPVLDKLTKGMPEAMENYADQAELARAAEFLTTVAQIEKLTGLDFGAEVRKADVRAGQPGKSPALDADTSVLATKPKKKPAKKKAAKKAKKKKA